MKQKKKLPKEFDLEFLNPSFNLLPIGDRAEILEMLERINYDSGHIYGLNKEIIGPIKIRKNFTWGHNTRPKIRDYINSIRWHRKRGSYSSIFQDEKNNRGSFMERRYKDKIIELDNKLRSLRWAGTQWIENDNEKIEVIKKAKDQCIKEISEACNIFELNFVEHEMPKRYIFDNTGSIEKDNLVTILDSVASVSEQTDNLHFIKFEEEEEINIVFDIKNDMELFYHSGKTPLHSFPHGKIIVVLRYSYNNFARRLLNLKTRMNHRDTAKILVFHKTENEDRWLRHPFMAIPSNIHRSHVHSSEHKWNEQQGHFAVCFGDFNVISHVHKFQLVKLIHSLIIWNKTFRIGSTNPINHIGYSWYGMIDNPTPELIHHGAALYSEQCRAMIRLHRDHIRHNVEERLQSEEESVCHDICSQCEDRCLEAEVKYDQSFICSNHPNYSKRMKAKEVKESIEELQSKSVESPEEMEEAMRLWAVANR